MKSIKFTKEPGYVFDLFFLFTLYFNEEYCLKNFVNSNKIAEDTEYFKELLKEIGDVPKELLLFFKLRSDKKCLMSSKYFEAFKEDFLTGEYNLMKVQMALADYERVIDNVLQFYFSDCDARMLSKNKTSILKMNHLIQQSNHTDAIKSALYSFIIEPIPIIQKLSCQLTIRSAWLSQQYENKYNLLSGLETSFDCDTLKEQLKLSHIRLMNIDGFDNVLFSFSLYNKNLIKTFFYEDMLLIQLGWDYQDCLEEIMTRKKLPGMEAFGNVVSEPNRVGIINLIYQRGEVTIKEIEEELKMSATNTYYHIAYMIKTGMLNTRNKGRTLFYSLNEKYFGDLSDMLRKYAKQE